MNWSMFLKRAAPLLISMSIALVVAVVHVVIVAEIFQFGPLSKNGMLHLLELKAMDLKFLGRKMPQRPEPKVVIAAIDEKGVDRFGLWPWPRTVTAEFIRKAGEGGAKVIAFDAVFSDEDRNSSYASIKQFVTAYEDAQLTPNSKQATKLVSQVQEAAKIEEENCAALADLEKKIKQQAQLKQQLMPALVKARKGCARSNKNLQLAQKALDNWRKRSSHFFEYMRNQVAEVSPDVALAEAIAEHADKVVLGYFSFYNKSSIVGVSDEEGLQAFDRLDPVALTDIFESKEIDIGGSMTVMIQPVEGVDISKMRIRESVAVRAPLPLLSSNAKYFGYFNAVPDPDGPVRDIRLFNRYQDKMYPALSLISAARYFDAEVRPLNGEFLPNITLDGVAPLNPDSDVKIPCNMRGHLYVNYYEAPEKYFPTYSVADFVDGTLPADVYKDKIVLFGMTALGLFDMRPTPFSSTTPGVYIHASAIQNMVDDNYVARMYGIELIEVGLFLLLGLLMGLGLPRLPAWGGVLATLGLVGGLYAVDVGFVFPSGTWLKSVTPTLQALLTFIGISVHGYLTEGKEKRKIRKAFQFYLTKSVVEEMLKDPSKLKLGGEKRTCSVLFSDIRGFTTISERLTPEALVQLLNEYLTPMTNIVFRYDGTLDKYMGDAVMAIFGAPVAHKDHPARACSAALDMMKDLHRLQEGWREQGLPELDIGIGINTGPMSVGNMGSDVRFDYTVMGDNVNLGSRLEGINKQYGTNIIVSEYTCEAARGSIQVREMDSVRVKGKREPVKIYELLGMGAPSGKVGELISTFEEGIKQYKGQAWDKAIGIFERVRTDLKENDFASGMYIERCQAMRENPPGDEWDGVYTMTTK